MKRTFRLLAMGLLAVGLLASCNKKENNNGTANGEGFKAITEQGGGNSKTYGVLTSDTQLEVRWKAGDQIKVNNGSETCTFQLTSGEDQTSGEFNRLSGTTFDYTTGDFTAIYPVVNTEGVENTVGASTATFNLPATQTFDEDHLGSFAEKAMPMMAHATNQTLYFKNVLGGVCFPLVGNGLHVTKVVLTSSSTTDMLWGVFNANYTNDEPALTYVSGGSNSITLNCDVTLDATRAVEFTIMVPPGALAAGFTVAAYDGEIKIYEKSTQTAPGADFIPRNTIRVVNNDLNVVINALTVTTVSPSFINTTSAYSGGIVTVNAKDVTPVTERGLCWALASETNLPTLDNNNVADGQAAAGIYGFTIDGLTVDQIYYVRAYAKNTLGEVVYGNAIPFATRKNYADGRLSGAFTVNSSGTKVNFSMGNLQYQASTNTWRFAEYQFDYVGDATNGLVYEGDVKSNNELGAANYTGWIDLYGWGASGYNHGAVCWRPWARGENTSYYAYGESENNLNSSNGKADWGYNAILNGGNTENSGWRTLQDGTNGDNKEEWKYLPTRNYTYLFAYAQMYVKGAEDDPITTVNGVSTWGKAVNGLMLFPDNFSWPSLVGDFAVMNNYSAWDANMLTEAQWSMLEKAGAVFLPASGYYLDDEMNAVNSSGHYWSASRNTDGAWGMHCYEDVIRWQVNCHRRAGRSVRLVKPAL